MTQDTPFSVKGISKSVGTYNIVVKVNTKGCSILLWLFTWHMKAYCFFHSLLATLRLRKKMTIVISVEEKEKKEK